MTRRTMEGMQRGLEAAREAAGRAADEAARVEWRRPWTYRPRRESAWGNPWMIAALAGAALLGAAAWLYLRKRRQVADRYTMAAPETGVTEPVNGYAEAGRRTQPA